MFRMLTLIYALNAYLTLTKINKYYIYDDHSLYIFFSSLIFEAGYLSPMVSIRVVRIGVSCIDGSPRYRRKQISLSIVKTILGSFSY